MTSAPLPDRRSNLLESEAAARVGGLFERHGRMVYGVCRAMLRDVHEAEDAAQQVFLSAHKALLGGARVRDSGGWLATIARNECRGRIAARMRAPLPVSDEDLAAIPSTVDEQARHDQALEFREALAALPERQREAVVLRYLFGLRYGEVATALGLSRPATEALLFRARRGLRGRLRPVVGTVLVVPLALREELALAIPGFSSGAAGASAVAAGAAGGVLAKLAAGPVGVKVATAAVAVSTVGVVGTIDSDRPARSERDRAPIVATSTGTTSDDQEARSGERRSGADRDEATSDESAEEDRSGPGGRGDATDEIESDWAGPSSGSGGGRPRVDDDSLSGSTSAEDSGSSGSGESIDTTAEADSTDSGDLSSGGSDDDGTSSGSSGSGSGSSGSGSGSSGSGSGSSGSPGSGSEDPPDDEEP